MHRGIFVITASASNLNIEFINKRVGQTGKLVHEETIGFVGSTNDVLAVASPLVGSSKITVLQLSGKGDHIVLASVVGTNNVHNGIRIHRNDNGVGFGIDVIYICSVGHILNHTFNCVLTHRVTFKQESLSEGVGRHVIDIPATSLDSGR